MIITNKLVLSILFSPVSTTVNNCCCFINVEQHCWNNSEEHCSLNIVQLWQPCCYGIVQPIMRWQLVVFLAVYTVEPVLSGHLAIDLALLLWFTWLDARFSLSIISSSMDSISVSSGGEVLVSLSSCLVLFRNRETNKSYLSLTLRCLILNLISWTLFKLSAIAVHKFPRSTVPFLN